MSLKMLVKVCPDGCYSFGRVAAAFRKWKVVIFISGKGELLPHLVNKLMRLLHKSMRLRLGGWICHDTRELLADKCAAAQGALLIDAAHAVMQKGAGLGKVRSTLFPPEAHAEALQSCDGVARLELHDLKERAITAHAAGRAKTRGGSSGGGIHDSGPRLSWR